MAMQLPAGLMRNLAEYEYSNYFVQLPPGYAYEDIFRPVFWAHHPKLKRFDCIRVVAEENTPDNRVSAGERYARIYEINMSRCIFCGYCEVACPFDAITLEGEYELSEYNRPRDLVYTKDMLLAPHPKPVPLRAPDQEI